MACWRGMTETSDDTASAPVRKGRDRRAPRKITPAYLANYATFYLERYASSAENLRRVLYRRVWKSCRYHGTDEAEAQGWADELVARFAAAGLVDDRLYAEGRVRALFRRGVPPAMIRRRLAAKGVDAEEIDRALDALAEDGPDPEFAAAVAYARRRRFGPWRVPEARPERRQKDLAAMARAGFSYDMALQVIDADSEDALHEALAAGGVR